jgi:L-fucose mutarotase/ribose pyranase (RbsD/FucU family)
MNNIESFSKDKDMAELLELLSKTQNRDAYEKVVNTIAYVESLENTLSSMMKEIVEMREEIKTVHQQNEYMMTKAERGIKDVLLDQVAKVETKAQELYVKLAEAKDSLKKFAAFTAQKAKMFGNSVLLKLVDAVHLRQGLDKISKKADKMTKDLDSMSEMVEDYKKSMKRKTERNNVTPYKAEDYRHEEQTIAAVAKPSFTYEQYMDNFMADRVSEGVTYSCNQDAYEDFKASFDKKQGTDSAKDAVQKQIQSAVSKKSR